MQKPKRIELVAPMGVGKTRLMMALAAHFTTVAEPPNNPHLQEFITTRTPESAFKKDQWFLEEKNKALQAAYDQENDKPLLTTRQVYE